MDSILMETDSVTWTLGTRFEMYVLVFERINQSYQHSNTNTYGYSEKQTRTVSVWSRFLDSFGRTTEQRSLNEKTTLDELVMNPLSDSALAEAQIAFRHDLLLTDSHHTTHARYGVHNKLDMLSLCGENIWWDFDVVTGGPDLLFCLNSGTRPCAIAVMRFEIELKK